MICVGILNAVQIVFGHFRLFFVSTNCDCHFFILFLGKTKKKA